MLESGATNLVLFFVMLAICVIFVIAWMLKSESRIKVCKEEIKRLREKTGFSERENFMLLEEIEKSKYEPADTKPEKESVALEKENKILKAELDKARNSLEKIHRAALEKKGKD